MGTFTSKGTFELLLSVCMSKLKQYDRKTQESKGLRPICWKYINLSRKLGNSFTAYSGKNST